ncbi:DUF4365 domain-containing protein [Corynebacterium sp. SCR221107]|uniref:DUF4365 domain-containing protein n=1 Tax=Corynebacterium sp. SCR221107 TaxID=3017361 RepID=UPI0022EC64D5|nr:DUF4365 domain-containing protein [Corynebacterium sp. SCR221107]WBT08812.1 DUF4365 domain-containing protein [Corynebacterium sp. SCR221107]
MGTVLSEDACKEVIGQGLAYALAAHSAVEVSLTSPGQDHLAKDCTFAFPEADLRVQLKSTASPIQTKGMYAFDLEYEWMEKWAQSRIPVILVLTVIHEKERSKWIEFEKSRTLFTCDSHWVRVDDFSRNHLATGSTTARRIHFPKDQSIGPNSVALWRSLVIESFGLPGTGDGND